MNDGTDAVPRRPHVAGVAGEDPRHGLERRGVVARHVAHARQHEVAAHAPDLHKVAAAERHARGQQCGRVLLALRKVGAAPELHVGTVDVGHDLVVERLHVDALKVGRRRHHLALAFARRLAQAEQRELVAVGGLRARLAPRLLEQLDEKGVGVDRPKNVEQDGRERRVGVRDALLVDPVADVGELEVALANGLLAREHGIPDLGVRREDADLPRSALRPVGATPVDAVKGDAPARALRDPQVGAQVLEHRDAERVVEARARRPVVDEETHVQPGGLKLGLAVVVVGRAGDEVVGADRCLRRAARIACLLLLLFGARHGAWLVEHDDDVRAGLDGPVDLVDQHAHVGRKRVDRRRGLHHEHVAIDHDQRLRARHADRRARICQRVKVPERASKLVLERSLGAIGTSTQSHCTRPCGSWSSPLLQ